MTSKAQATTWIVAVFILAAFASMLILAGIESSRATNELRHNAPSHCKNTDYVEIGNDWACIPKAEDA